MTNALQLEAVEPVIETIQIADLKIDPDLQCRARGTQAEVVRQYAEDMKRGDIFPPITIFRDAKNAWVVNGFHRVAAALAAGLSELQAEVKSGSKRDGLLYAVQADRGVGLRRTTQDKRRSIELLIGTFPKMSDRKIGEACGVDNKTVAATRARLTKPTEEIPHPETEQPAALPEPTDPEAALVVMLLKKCERIISQCPESKRVELWAHITSIFESKTEPKISEAS